MVRLCELCNTEKARIKRPKNGMPVCLLCFYTVFEEEIHHTIITSQLFKRGERIAIGASGGTTGYALRIAKQTIRI